MKSYCMELKQDVINRIKFAAPITMLMLTMLFERNILNGIVPVLSFYWFILIISFFVISTFIVGLSLYIYKLLNHHCGFCKTYWTKIKLQDIYVNDFVTQIGIFKWGLYLKVTQVMQRYKCQNCKQIKNRKVKKISFLGFNQ